MTTFNSINDFKKWVDSKQGQQSLLNTDNVKQVLMKEARRLEKYLKEELQSYYSSYSPTVYQRTGNTVDSLRVTPPRRLNNSEWSIGIEFDPSLANHYSYIGEDQPDGYTPWLLEVGWDIRDKIGYDAPMFTHHKGTKYITKAVERFNKDNPYGLKISVTMNGKDYI